MYSVHCNSLAVKSLPHQLLDAMHARRWSVPRLLKESGLQCDRTSLLRKLKGEQKLSTDEAERLSQVLDCTLAWVPEEKDRDLS